MIMLTFITLYFHIVIQNELLTRINNDICSAILHCLKNTRSMSFTAYKVILIHNKSNKLIVYSDKNYEENFNDHIFYFSFSFNLYFFLLDLFIYYYFEYTTSICTSQ